jgi:hypothetical protein
MSYIQSKKIRYVNSHDRLSGTNGNFTINVEMNPNDQFDQVCVLQAKVPKSYYAIRSTNSGNTFTLEENAIETTISIAEGNYTRKTFKTTLEAALNTASPNNWTYAVSIPAITAVETGKYTFSVTGNAGIQPSFIVNTAIYEAMGFNIDSTNTFTSDSLTSTNVSNISPEDTLFIHSDICSNDNNDDILIEIYGSVGEAPFSNIHWVCPDVQAYSKPLRTNSSNVYSFAITDEDNNLISLNGQNTVITILLWKKEPIFNMIRAYIQMRTEILRNKNTSDDILLDS